MSKKKIMKPVYITALEWYAEVCAIPKPPKPTKITADWRSQQIDDCLQGLIVLEKTLAIGASQGAAPLLQLVGQEAVDATLAEAKAMVAKKKSKGGSK